MTRTLWSVVVVGCSASQVPLWQGSGELVSDDLFRLFGELRALEPDVAVVVAYGQIFRRRLLELPRLGCVNVHASLLPRWRGAAPIQRAIEAGDETTGITIMQMDEGLDTGPILLQEEVAILPDETAGQLHDRIHRQFKVGKRGIECV